MAQTVRKLAIGAAAALFIVRSLPIPLSASAAEYPRRIAIAPFVNLTGQDEIKPVVTVLPRLLSTRLMALSGAETLLLPPGGKTPEEAAKEARAPLLLQGTVSKLGKGYSIDTTVTDLATGTSAGAFFSSAATEDEIIPQVGVLAADMAEKLFGVRTARPQPSAAPAQAPAVAPASQVHAPAPAAGPAGSPAPPSAAPVPAPAAAAPVASPAGAAATPPAGAAATPAPAAAPFGPWEPKSIVKIGNSDRIPDELFRIAMADVDGDGELEVVALGKRTIYFYRVKGDTVVPVQPTRIARSVSHHFLNVEFFDVDGDGRPEIVVTDIVSDRLRSFILKFRNGTFESIAEDIPYYIVALSDLEGKPTLAGQSTGVEKIYQGGIEPLSYSGGKMTGGKALKIPYEDGIFGLNAVRIGKEGRYVYLDADEYLRLWNDKGKTLGKTKDYFSGARDGFERGPIPRGGVSAPQTWIRGRVVPLGGDPGNPFLLVRQAEGIRYMKELRRFKNSRLVIGRYDGTFFVNKVYSETIEPLITDDYPVVDKGGRGALVAATVLEETGSALETPQSRVFLYRVE